MEAYTESGIDTTLSSDSVASRREELGDTRRLESSLCKTERCTQTSTTGTATI